MAVTADQLKVVISSEGGGTAARNISKVGRSARDAAGDVDEMGDELGDMAQAATMMVVPARAAASSIDEIGDESVEAGAQAGAAAGGIGTLAGATSGLRISMLGLSGSITSVVTTLGLLTLALAPILPAVAAASGALVGLAGAFGLILGSGIIAWGDGFKTALEDVKKELKAVIKPFGQQFIPLLKSALTALPDLVRSLLDAAGNMQPFVTALKRFGAAAMRILPKVVKLFMDVARQALPAMTRLGNWLAKNLVPALRALMKAGQRAAGPVARVGKVIYDIGKSLAGVAGWVGRFVVALWDLAAAAGGAGKNLGSAFGRVKKVVKQGLKGAFNWIRSSGIPLAKKALNKLWQGVTATFDWLKTDGKKLVKQGLRAVWNWVKGPGAKAAKKAFQKIWDKVKKAFDWLKTDGKKRVKKGAKKIWQWVKGPGKKTTKKAFDTLWSGVKPAFKWLKQDGLQMVKKGMRGIWGWVKGPGKKKTKKAFDKMWAGAKSAFNWLKTDGWKQSKTGLKRITKWFKGPGKKLLKTALKTLWQFSRGQLGWQKAIKGKVRWAFNRAKKWITTKGLSMFLNAFYTIGNNLGPALASVLDTITQAFKNGIPKIRDWLRNHGTDMVKKSFGALGTAVRLLILGMFAIGGLIGSAFTKGFQGIVDWLKDGGAKKLEDAFRNMVSGIISYLRNNAAGDIKGAFEFVWDLATTAVEAFVDNVIGNSIIPDMISDIVSYFKNGAASDLKSAAGNMLDSVLSAAKTFATDFVSDIKQAARDAANGLINSFNRVMPNSFSIPSVTVGGGTWNPPGPGKVNIPQETFGGQRVNIPHLDTGGLIESDGLAMLHAGEEVVPSADVDRDGSGGTTITVNVDARGATDPHAVGTAVSDELRSVLPR